MDSSRQGYFAERWMALKFGDWVNQVSGQFSQYTDPKWNLIHSVS